MPKAAKVHNAGAHRQAYDKARRGSAVVKFRSSWRWKCFRAMFLDSHPLCWLCDKADRIEPAKQVHHVKPLHSHMDLGLVESNCKGLCTACHAKVEAMERNGQDSSKLFEGI